MRKLIVVLAFCIPLLVSAQQTGIQWVEGLTWGQILQKAKAENKYIFLDCHATWCRPCHAMDKDVYPTEEVGKAINEKFIAVKVQMDRTGYDNELTKIWYPDAKRLETNYTVTAFPTFLFFYPDGKPMHRAVGYRNSEEFVTVSKEALDPKKQYYALLQEYRPGKFDTSELKGLARALRSSGGDLASKMAIEYLTAVPKAQLGNEDNINLMCEFRTSPQMQEFAFRYLSAVPGKYFSNANNLILIRNFSAVPSISELVLTYFKKINNDQIARQLSVLTVFDKEQKAKQIADKYINALKEDKIYTKENLQFIRSFTKSSTDKGFKIFQVNSKRVDKVVGYNSFSEGVLSSVIIKEEYDIFYKDAVAKNLDNIPWDSISQIISKKYGSSLSEKLDLHVKSSLYKYFADNKGKYWPEYIKYYIEKVERYGTDTTGPQHQFLDVIQINNFVWDAIFFHSNDTQQMKTGLRWMEGVIRRNPKEANNIDTYANLLYKLGRKEEAIQWEEKAVKIAIEEKQDWALAPLQDVLAKMKKGEPTWIKEKVE